MHIHVIKTDSGVMDKKQAELVEMPLQRLVSQQSLVKVKFKPMPNFFAVMSHRAGRTQLFSYKTIKKISC